MNDIKRTDRVPPVTPVVASHAVGKDGRRDGEQLDAAAASFMEEAIKARKAAQAEPPAEAITEAAEGSDRQAVSGLSLEEIARREAPIRGKIGATSVKEVTPAKQVSGPKTTMGKIESRGPGHNLPVY